MQHKTLFGSFLVPCVSGAGQRKFDLLIKHTFLYHVVLFEFSALLVAALSQTTMFLDTIK